MTCTKVKLNGKIYNAARPIPSHVGMSKRSWIVELDAFALIASKTACHSQRYKVKDSGARRKIWKNKICIQYVYVYIYTRRKRSQDRMSLAFKKFRLSKSPTPLFTGSSNHQPLQQLSGSLAWAAPDLATFLSYTLDETPWNWRQHMFQRMNPSLGVS